MATPRNDSYTAAAGLGIFGGRVDPSLTPAWRSSMAAWEWKELPSANLSAVGPATVPGNLGYRDGRINAWNGLTVLDNKVVLAGTGGHNDWGGNEGYSLDMSAASPTWVMLGQPSPDAVMVMQVGYYNDGRPTASHTYYSLFTDPARNKIFRMGVGSAWGTDGNTQLRNVDAFNLVDASWDAALAWPIVPEALSYGQSQAQDPVTGNIYVCGNTRLWRFNLAMGTWASLAVFPDNGTATYYRPMVVDTVRNRLVVFGDLYAQPLGILIYDIAGNTWSKSSLNGSAAAAAVAGDAGMAHYLSSLGKFVVCTSSNQIIEVDPVTRTAVNTVTTGLVPPTPINGVFQKFQYMPVLKGFAYQPRGNSKMWFLASE